MLVQLEDTHDFHKGAGATVIEALKDAAVVSIKKTPDGLFRFKEQCDHYYSAKLSKEQMLSFAEEIVALANS